MDPRYQYDPKTNPFDPDAKGYQANNALWLAAAGNLAYENEKTIRTTVQKWGFKRFRFLHFSSPVAASDSFLPVDTQAFVCSNDKVTLIAFRGTEPLNVKDWFTDLMVGSIPAPIGLGNVHKGFDAAFAAIRPQLQSTLSEQHDGKTPIWITGHSLGGALAMLTAVQLKFSYKLPVQGVYTFGQPRVGDRTFAKFAHSVLGDRMVRFVNNKDIVPQVPSPKMLLNYWHNNPELHFDPDGRLIMKKTWWDRARSLMKNPRVDAANLTIEALTDHSMDRYVERVRKQLSEQP